MMTIMKLVFKQRLKRETKGDDDILQHFTTILQSIGRHSRLCAKNESIRSK